MILSRQKIFICVAACISAVLMKLNWERVPEVFRFSWSGFSISLGVIVVSGFVVGMLFSSAALGDNAADSGAVNELKDQIKEEFVTNMDRRLISVVGLWAALPTTLLMSGPALVVLLPAVLAIRTMVESENGGSAAFVFAESALTYLLALCCGLGSFVAANIMLLSIEFIPWMLKSLKIPPPAPKAPKLEE